MKRDFSTGDGMDMLLDTMCCTFGGVCFIALMVTLISSVAPAGDEGSENIAAEIERMAEREVDRLKYRRDTLAISIAQQEAFVASNENAVVSRSDLSKMMSELANDNEKLRLYEKKIIEYQDELAKLTTDSEYSKREAARLERLLAELRDKAGKPLFERHRAVRTPQERTLSGLRSVDVWLYKHRLYKIDDESCVSVRDVSSGGTKAWDCTIIPGRGERVDESGFFSTNGGWWRLTRELGTSAYMRIFTDIESFEELCVLRDALVSRNSKYNWIIQEGNTIHFVEGYDGRVQ